MIIDSDKLKSYLRDDMKIAMTISRDARQYEKLFDLFIDFTCKEIDKQEPVQAIPIDAVKTVKDKIEQLEAVNMYDAGMKKDCIDLINTLLESVNESK